MLRSGLTTRSRSRSCSRVDQFTPEELPLVLINLHRAGISVGCISQDIFKRCFESHIAIFDIESVALMLQAFKASGVCPIDNSPD